jgi:predicted outer membrane protein
MKMLSSLVLMGIAATAFAASPPTGSGLIEKLAEGGMTEVEAGKLALAKSTVRAVKETTARQTRK